MATDEIKKDNFVYRDTLFADVGGNKRHPRASAAELKDLLLPKKSKPPPQDQVAHWYEAQLLHYGLPRTKDKNTAKVRLTSAIAAGSLVVPDHLVRMEADMKKEFAAVNRKAKAAMKKAAAADSSNQPSHKDKKRKADAVDSLPPSASTTKMSITVGNITFDIDHREDVVNNSKKRKGSLSDTAKVAVPKATTSKATTAKATIPKATASNAAISKTAASKSTKSQTSSTKEIKHITALKSSVTTMKASKKQAVGDSPGSPVKPAPVPKAKPTARKSTGKPTPSRPTQKTKKSKTSDGAMSSKSPTFSPTLHKHELLAYNDQHDEDEIMDDAPPPYSSIEFKHEQTDSEDDNHEPHIQISGTYIIDTNYDDMHCELTLVKNIHTGHFWGHFVVAGHRGVLHIPQTYGITSQEAIRFNWRAEDLETGQLRFRREQDGWIQFDGSGGVRGCWNSLLDDSVLDFEGRLDVEPDVEVEELIHQWEWFVKSAYGR